MTRQRSPQLLGALLTVAALAITACGNDPDDAHTVSPALLGDRDVIFWDGFDDDELGDEWTTCFWWQVDGGCTIASNGEQQWYRPEAVGVADGSAVLSATVDEQTTTDGSTLEYRSGMITTGHVDNDVDDPGFAFTYGLVEARVRFPEGDGLWPAVWLLSADRTSLPEIDIVEWYGSRETVMTAHVHQRVDGERASSRVESVQPNVAGEWHTVAALWESDRVEFFVDEQSVGVVDDPELIPDTPMYLVINLALGGNAGDVDDDALPQELLIDWVRVSQ